MSSEVTNISGGRLPPVAVVGAGLIGLAIAWRLAQQGAPVTVIERDRPGCGASGAAAGMLSVGTEHGPGDDAFLALLRASREQWPGFAQELESASELRVGLMLDGALIVSRSADETRRLSDLGRPLLTRKEIDCLQPGTATGIEVGFLAGDDGRVDNRAVVRALERAISAAGARVLTADAIEVRQRSGRVVGIVTEAGMVAADAVVVAAGVGTSPVLERSGLSHVIPRTLSVKGQALALQMNPDAPLVRMTVRDEKVYLVPRASGRLIVGATSEAGVDDVVVSGNAIEGLSQYCQELIPDTSALPLIDAWAGLRPFAGAGMPVIGPAGPDGLYIATGHYRNGVLLTPITADIVSRMILNRTARADTELVAPFLPMNSCEPQAIDTGAAERN